MIKKIAIAVVVPLGALLIYAATQPDNFRIQRAVTIKAPPERIFAVLNDFLRWESWSPWEKKDPAIDRKSTRLNSSHLVISYAVFCLKKKTRLHSRTTTRNLP